MKVYFIGAGPGDPELITVKGLKLIQRCPVILYAGSLVPEEVLGAAPATAKIIDTASLHLDEIIEHIAAAKQANSDVARVHSGDPSLYGAISEQMQRLDALAVDYEIIPGVTSTAAAAAALKRELTLPGITQSVILTRYPGKTPFPEREKLPALAQHGATLAIHLSITRLHAIVADLIPFYGADCPVAVCYRVGWPDQEIITGTLSDIVVNVRRRGISRTALILVGQVLAPQKFDNSYLYAADQAHVYRPRVKPNVPRKVKR